VIASCFYPGNVVHIRRTPARHRLGYRVFMGLFDLDELPGLSARSPLFGYNRPGVMSFHDCDHCDGSGKPLRGQVERALAESGIEPPGGAIRILCMPRLLGYVFNPLSVYFCHDRNGHLRSVVHEVNNTFGERHLYALRAAAGSDGLVRQHCGKDFRVSPFLPMNLDYRFTIRPPGENVSVHIGVEQDGADILSTWFAGRRQPFTAAALLRLWLQHPAMTIKVITGIHWEALFLWLKLRRARRSEAAADSRQAW
jgi:uncharacterized protein